MWLSGFWTTAAVYNVADKSSSTASGRGQPAYTMLRRAVQGFSVVARDNIVLVGLLLSLAFVILLKRRRCRIRIPVGS